MFSHQQPVWEVEINFRVEKIPPADKVKIPVFVCLLFA
jgi:hypothetical protein